MDKNYKKAVINNQETIVATAEAKSTKRFVSNMTAIVIIALLSLIGDCFFVGVSIAVGIADKSDGWIIIVFICSLIIHLVPEIYWLSKIFEKQVKLDATVYYVTDERVLGAFKKDQAYNVEQIFVKEIKSFKVKSGFMGKILKLSDVVIFTESDKFTMYGLSNFDKIVEVLDEVVIKNEEARLLALNETTEENPTQE